MTWYARIAREPATLLGVVTSLLGLVVIFGVDLSDAQTGALIVFVGAVVALLRFVTTPASEVIAQQRPGEPVKATAKAESTWGIPADAVVRVDVAA